MQNTMLDSIVSSNSQALFDFNAEHNGEACIESLDPKDKGTERQFRFTRALHTSRRQISQYHRQPRPSPYKSRGCDRCQKFDIGHVARLSWQGVC